ncbi:MAG TPA: phosphatidate cytidylyltransferase [Anaerolineales bacterium]|nr:phosphatidate cytidylyltransferase [Anaerolineales bacterium]
MLIKRTITSLALAAVGIPAIIFGGIYYFLLILLFLGAAAWEYGQIFSHMNCKPSQPILIGGVILVVVARTYLPTLESAALVLTVLVAMAWHLLDYEKGRDQAATDFAVTVSGIVYVGWIGSYLVSLRNMPDGLWWVLIVLPTIWLADMAAYFIGSRYGRHTLSPRLSPKKTWEGYWAGVVCGTISAVLLALLWHAIGGPGVLWWKAAALGAALSVLTTLGDLGESMLKRQAGVKDSSNIFPGHGGVLDRIDSWLWGAVLGYFLITWFLL